MLLSLASHISFQARDQLESLVVEEWKIMHHNWSHTQHLLKQRMVGC